MMSQSRRANPENSYIFVKYKKFTQNNKNNINYNISGTGYREGYF